MDCLKHPEATVASEERFSVVKAMLTNAGWELVRINGSHHVFSKANAQTVSIPVHNGKVKPVYVRQVKQITKGD
jgi:predicted RNA binding protein YcfA (HicA-like mRNA interferase family)